MHNLALDCPLAGIVLTHAHTGHYTGLIHLNHSNPLHGPGPERDWLAARGIRVGAFGAQWRLD